MRKLFSSMALAMAFAMGLTGNFAYASNGCKIAGPENARITIEEFVDFHCPYCVKGANTMKQVVKDYPDKVKLVFRNMPLPGHNPGALTAAKAFSAVCLQNPSSAYQFQAELFDNQDKLIQNGEAFLFETAEKLHIDVPRMKSDMQSSTVEKMISDDQQAANSNKFRGTPSFLIGSERIVGSLPYDDIKQIIDKQLKTN